MERRIALSLTTRQAEDLSTLLVSVLNGYEGPYARSYRAIYKQTSSQLFTERAAEAPAANETGDSPKGEADAR